MKEPVQIQKFGFFLSSPAQTGQVSDVGSKSCCHSVTTWSLHVDLRSLRPPEVSALSEKKQITIWLHFLHCLLQSAWWL